MSDAPVLIGIDVGTTNVKAVAYDVEGRALSAATRRQTVRHPQPGWSEYDPDTMFGDVAEALRKVVGELGEREVAGVAVASMAETAVPVDSAGEPLHAAIAWHDERSRPQAAWWQQHVGDEAVYATTGLPILPIFGANKLMWWREHDPDGYARLDAWLNTADYVAYRLCGERATDLSLASRVMLLDLDARDWSETLLDAADVPRAALAELVPSGTYLGGVHAAARASTGLPEGTPVIAGAHDHPCGALALGVVRQGDVLDSIGTSEAVLTVMERPVLDQRMARSGYQQGVHPAPNAYYCNGGLYTAGAAVEWLRGVLDEAAEADLDRLLEADGRSGVFFLPHLRLASPPHVDAASRAAFVGVRAHTSRADLACAVVDGLAFEAQASLEGMERLLGFSARRVRAIGGGARIQRLLRSKAALLGQELQVAEAEEATTLGAAMLAGVGAGVFPSVAAASAALAPAWRRVAPDAGERAWLRPAFEEVYAQLYATLAPVHRSIQRLLDAHGTSAR